MILTDKAEYVYLNSDPLDLTITGETESGKLRYSITGIIERHNLTEQEVNEILESIYDLYEEAL